MATDDMDIVVRLKGARAAGAEAKTLRGDILGIAGAQKEASASSGRLSKRVKGLGSSYVGAAKGLVAMGAGFASYQGIKSSIDTTVMLGKTTIGLTKNLAFSTKVASEWAAVAETRGVDMKALNMSFGKLATNVDTANKGWDKQNEALKGLGATQADQLKRQALLAKGAGPQADAFKRLGVSQKTLAEGDFNKILAETADGFERLGSGPERTALSMKLFGRGWQTVVPLLRGGSKEMREQLKLADKYGVTFKGKTVKSVQDLIDAQREAKFATMGLQVAIGTQLIPIVTKGIGAFSKFVYQMRSGTGAGGRFRAKVEQVWKAAKPVVTWFGRAAESVFKFASAHPGLVKIATALFLASKALKLLRFGSAISGAKTLWGWFGKAEGRAAGMPARLIAKQALFARAGMVLGGIFAAHYIAQLLKIENADPLLFLNPPNAGDPRPGHGDIVKHPGQQTRSGVIRDAPPLHRNLHPGRPVRTAPPSAHHVRPKIAAPAAGGGDGAIIIHHITNLDGKQIWESWDRHDRKKRNGR